MFDVGFDEMLVIAVVAIVVIGPKDLPMALRTVGRWVAKVRSVSGHFRSGIDTMIREAELEEMEKKWREQNAAVMREHPQLPHDSLPDGVPEASAEAAITAPPPPTSKADAMTRQALAEEAAPQLPLSPP